jgi:hypothetical protein
VGKSLVYGELLWRIVEIWWKMGWHHFSNASHHRPDSKYIMLKNCGNTIYYAVDPAVKIAFLWCFHNTALTTSGFGSIIYSIN